MRIRCEVVGAYLDAYGSIRRDPARPGRRGEMIPCQRTGQGGKRIDVGMLERR